MTLIKAVWRWLCRKQTACCSCNRLHFSHKFKVNYSNTGVYNFLPNAAGVSWDWYPCPLCLVNGSPVVVLLKILFIRTVRSTVGGFTNNVSHMSSGKILATVLNVRSVRIDDQFKTFICECSQYWQFMTSMALIQYKTYICGMFCCYLLLYINIYFLETVRIRSAGVVDHDVDSIYPSSWAHCTSVQWTYCACKEVLYLVWRSSRLGLLSLLLFPERPRTPFVSLKLKSLQLNPADNQYHRKGTNCKQLFYFSW